MEYSDEMANCQSKDGGKGVDFVTFSPLLLLAFLPVGSYFVPYLTQTAVFPETAFLKYFSIPLVGFSIGFVLFLGMVRNGWELPAALSSYIEQHTLRITLFVACMFLFYLSSIAVLRYTSLHSSAFDMGSCDNKIWRISVASLSEIPLEVSLGHFQPILILHALVYKLIASPVIILALQATLMVSGVIPVYRLAQKHLCKPLLVFLMTTIYLLYPPVEFNATLDFHPDHIYVPLVLWAFYFCEKGDYWKGILLVGLGGMAKEPLLLGTAFFGLYLILSKKRYLEGTLMFITFVLIFFIIAFLLPPYIDKVSPFEHGVSPFVDTLYKKSSLRPHLLLETLLVWKVRKLLFVYLMLGPMMFLPLLDWKRFMPAVPLIAIPFMSTSILHSSADSQYSAGIIAPASVALIFTIRWLKERYGTKYAKASASFVLVMTLTFNIANSPSMLSVNFWKAGCSEIWHRSAFTRGKHENIIEQTIYRIPADPTVSVSSQGNINHARLAHRYEYRLFPDRWEDVDYIILDTKRPLMVGDSVDKEMYYEVLQNIENNPHFKLEFEQDGVLLYEKSK